MIISSVGQVQTVSMEPATPQPKGPPVDQSPAVLPQVEAEGSPPVEFEAEGGRGQGVLRKLLAGHYKGVAEVRLRINFHDELAAAEAVAIESTAGGAATDVAGAVGAQLGELGAALALTDEQLSALGDEQQTFSDAVSSAVQAFSGSEAGAAESLTESLQQAFDSLVATVQAIVTPEPVEAEAAPPPPILGDINGDGAVNITDLGIIATNWGRDGLTREDGDFTGDGTVTVTDLGVVASNWG
ncbi:hypothetical protein LCGC14_1367340, partial [marine sediment metagenome]